MLQHLIHVKDRPMRSKSNTKKNQHPLEGILVPIVCPSESALLRYQITVHQAGRQRYVQVIPHMLNIAINSGVDFRLTGAGQYSRCTI
jgi:hypothetical protein